MTREEFQNDIRAGIPDRLPAAKPYDKQINHAPKRKDILSDEEKTLALKNALRYFPVRHHGQYLKKHPLVQSYRSGEFGEGEYGVTIVEL